jgi:5-methylcytosine-specific restriction endonuclease McrA
MEKQTCRICQVEKEITDFEVDRRYTGTGHRTTRCKACKLRSNDKATHAYKKLCQRAERDGQKVEVTLNQVKALFSAYDGRCAYCNAIESEETGTFHLEHILARSVGGRNHISNLAISCGKCNRMKASKPLVTFMFDNEDRFVRDNFGMIAQFVAFTSKQPLNDIVLSMANDHVEYEYQRIIGDMDAHLYG